MYSSGLGFAKQVGTQRVKIIFCCMFQAEADVEQFLQEEHSYDDYSREVRKYHRLVDEISYNSAKVLFHINKTLLGYKKSCRILYHLWSLCGKFFVSHEKKRNGVIFPLHADAITFCVNHTHISTIFFLLNYCLNHCMSFSVLKIRWLRQPEGSIDNL